MMTLLKVITHVKAQNNQGLALVSKTALSNRGPLTFPSLVINGHLIKSTLICNARLIYRVSSGKYSSFGKQVM